jgi:hypothetical protein
LALEALAIKVYATRDSVEIQGIIPVDLVTIEQTSGCQLVWTKYYPAKEEPTKGMIGRDARL